MTPTRSFADAVREFHRACGYTHSSVPSADDQKRLDLWAALVQEEVEELRCAMGSKDLPKVADGLCDVIYVCIGAALAFGIPIEEVFNEIHRSNMSKVTHKDGVVRRDDGKILRPDTYSPPDIESILMRAQSR